MKSSVKLTEDSLGETPDLTLYLVSESPNQRPKEFLVSQRTATLESWHSTCDLHPSEVVSHSNQPDCDSTFLSKAPDGGWGWMCVFGCSLVHFILGGIGKSFGLLHVELTQTLNATDFAVAWIHSVGVSTRMCMGPLSSVIRGAGFSCRQMVMLGGCISMASYAASSLAVSSLPALIVIMGMFVGLGNSLAYTPSILIVGEYFETKKFMANGFAVAGSGIGTFFMPIVIQESISFFGVSGAILILGGVSFHFCVCGALYKPLRREKKRRLISVAPTSPPNAATNNSNEESKSKSSQDRHFLGIDFSLFRDSKFLFLSVSQFLAPLSVIPAIYYLPRMALSLWSRNSNEVLDSGDPKTGAALLLSVNGVLDVIGRAAFGIFTNYGIGKRHRDLVYALMPLGFAASSVAAPFVGALGFWPLAICSGGMGLFSGAYVALTPSVLSESLGREKLSSSFPLTLAIKGISGLTASPLAGAIVALALRLNPDSEPYVGVYMFAAAVGTVSGLVLLVWQWSMKRNSFGGT